MKIKLVCCTQSRVPFLAALEVTMGLMAALTIGQGVANATMHRERGIKPIAVSHLHRKATPAPMPMLIQGRVTAVEGDVVAVKTPDHGPGLSHGPGIHSMLIALGKTYSVNIATAAYEAWDGTTMPGLKLKVGDSVVMVLKPSTDRTALLTDRSAPNTYVASLIETAAPVARQ